MLSLKASSRCCSLCSRLSTVECTCSLSLTSHLPATNRLDVCRSFRVHNVAAVNERHSSTLSPHTPTNELVPSCRTSARPFVSRNSAWIRTSCLPGPDKHMQADGCLISFHTVSSAAVVSAVERALATCVGTVYVDLRSVPAPSLCTLDIIGELYGRVAVLAPQRNVVPLLSSAHPQGELKSLSNVGWCYHVHTAEDSAALEVSAYGGCNAKAEGVQCHRESWQLNQPDPQLVVRKSAVIPSEGETLMPFADVALGGTFDRMHAGHRLLLAAAAAVSSSRLFVGVADSKLLQGKRLKELIQDYDQRVSSVLGFLQDVCPSIDPVIMRLRDPDVPTRAETEEFMNAIVVSQETLKGGVKINNGRVKLGFRELVTIVVPVLGAMSSEGEKLSSTTLREADARKQRSL